MDYQNATNRPLLVIVLPFTLYGQDVEELTLRLEAKISKIKDASFSTIHSNYIRMLSGNRMKAFLNTNTLTDAQRFSRQAIGYYLEAQERVLTDEIARIRRLNSKVHFMVYMKHFNLNTFKKLLPTLVKANGGTEDFDLMALTAKQCDIDESHCFKGYKGKWSRYVPFSEDQIFAAMKYTMSLNEVREYCDDMLSKPKRVEINARILRGFIGQRLTPEFMRGQGFRIVVSFRFSREKVTGLEGREVKALLERVVNGIYQKGRMKELQYPLGEIARLLEDDGVEYNALDFGSEEVGKEVDLICKTLMQVYDIEEVYEDFDVVQSEKVNKEAPQEPVSGGGDGDAGDAEKADEAQNGQIEEEEEADLGAGDGGDGGVDRQEDDSEDADDEFAMI